MFRIASFIIMSLLIIVSCQSDNTKDKGKAAMLKDKIAQFAETELKYDSSLLTERQKVVVEKLYQAAKIMDEIFLDQVYADNYRLRTELQRSALAEDKIALQYFNIMFGPFDRLDHDKPFYGGDALSKPGGANYYPADMNKDEFEAWLDAHPQDAAAFKSEFTVIRREGEKLIAIPYSDYYAVELVDAANLLIDAAEYADNPSLKKYLLSRAEAFMTNDYFQSDMDWMDLNDHTIEVVIGPYEVYEDGLFNYKAGFECFLTLNDPQESEKLSVLAGYLNDMEKNLPIPEEYKNFARGSESPIVVVNEVFAAGDTKAGVQTLAFNLPNDERVREAKGSKKVMLKNLHEAKFEKILKPIAQKIIVEKEQNLVTFDAFFNHTLMHEISHGLGPGKIKIDGRDTEVRTELENTYSTIEECKADLLGMYNDKFMIEKGYYPEEFEREMWTTFLAGVFRSIRFGISGAHGASNAIIYNYFLEKGAYVFDEKTGRVAVNPDTINDVLRELVTRILTIQATGDLSGAKALIENYAVESPSILQIRASLIDIPVDIRPVYQIEKELAGK